MSKVNLQLIDLFRLIIPLYAVDCPAQVVCHFLHRPWVRLSPHNLVLQLTNQSNHLVTKTHIPGG